MRNCEPRGFKVLASDVKKATDIIIEHTTNRRKNRFEKEVQEFQNGFFEKLFKVTHTQAVEHVSKQIGLMSGSTWSFIGWGPYDWATEKALALDIIQDEYVWLSSEDAANVSHWLNSTPDSLNNTDYKELDVFVV